MAAPKQDYTVAEAQRELPALIDRVQAGEAVRIKKRGRVIAQVQPVDTVGRAGARVLGGMRGTAVLHDDLIEPLDEPWDAA